MTISFQCKKCGKNYKVSDDKAGKKIKCRQCSAPVRIPEAEVDDFTDDWEEEAEETPLPRRRARSASKSKPKPKRKNKSSSGLNQNLLIIGGIVAILAIGGGGYFMFFAGKPGSGLVKSITDKADEIINSQGGSGSQKVKASELDNMKKIGRAFHDYHDSFTRFPPADAHLVDGKPLLSWRVHLLPFLGQAEIYKQFNLQEPWDSPQNSALLEKMPAVFQCTGVNKPGYTSIMTFSGEGTPFPGGRGIRLRDITDGSSNTLLCVKAGPDKAIPWTKPVDLPFNSGNPFSALGQSPNGSFLSAAADGSVRNITSDLPAQTLRNLIQHQDGNPL
ncbi:DUF1559 domain-containing protein [uncultured Gimesia sp.]|uniref:DUF1559 family PulG-like putative transporter n=1 Tax=uncultured Gimesia sp. TaxID=1678688 RepID=UPI0030DD6130|tara:strand:+ start:15269 stop:16264 length:996 start_codon:yes stop_codon:yes gene_type:complete